MMSDGEVDSHRDRRRSQQAALNSSSSSTGNKEAKHHSLPQQQQQLPIQLSTEEFSSDAFLFAAAASNTPTPHAFGGEDEARSPPGAQRYNFSSNSLGDFDDSKFYSGGTSGMMEGYSNINKMPGGDEDFEGGEEDNEDRDDGTNSSFLDQPQHQLLLQRPFAFLKEDEDDEDSGEDQQQLDTSPLVTPPALISHSQSSKKTTPATQSTTTIFSTVTVTTTPVGVGPKKRQPLNVNKSSNIGSTDPLRYNPSHLIVTGVPHVYHDHSQLPDDSSFTRKKTGGVTQPFPEKLQEMLRSVAETKGTAIVSWLPHGRAFLVRKPKEFTEIIMPK